MGIKDKMLKAAGKNNTVVETSEEKFMRTLFNKMFYLDKDEKREPAFVKQMITRGLESQERVGLHASALIVGDNKFCVRKQVLSLLYKQLQGDQIEPSLMRIFEEGNAIHEKWQRLFIRAGYAKVKDLDYTRFNDEYEVSYTPDAIVTIPEYNEKYNWDGPMVCEIKSVNTFQFKKMTSHPTGKKQMQFYMFLTGIHKGFVLCDDKNTQDFKVFMYDYDPDIVMPIVERCEAIQFYKQKLFEEKKMVKRMTGCNSYNCKCASDCAMKDACFNMGIGRVRLDK